MGLINTHSSKIFDIDEHAIIDQLSNYLTTTDGNNLHPMQIKVPLGYKMHTLLDINVENYGIRFVCFTNKVPIIANGYKLSNSDEICYPKPGKKIKKSYSLNSFF